MPKKKKLKSEGEPEKRITILETPIEIIKPLLDKEEKVVIKNRERDEDFKKLLADTRKLIKDFLGNSAFKKIILEILAENDGADLLNPEVLKSIIYSLQPKVKIRKGIETVFKDLWRLSKVYGARIKLRKKEDGEISIETEYGFPNYEFFRIKGKDIARDTTSNESIQNLFSFCKRIVDLGCIVNEIEIREEPGTAKKEDSINPLVEVLSEVSDVSPTIITYRGRKGFKKMLVCIPPNMDLTTLTKQYAPLLAKRHLDFFKRKFRGRPVSKILVKKFLHEIWERRFKGTRHPITRRCEMASQMLREIYNIDLSPITIRRWYVKVIKGG